MFSLIILLLLKLSCEADSTTTPDMDETVCYVSDEEENDSDIRYVKSTNEEIDNIVNNPLQHAIVQQGPSQQGPSHEGPTHQAPTNQRPTQQEPTHHGANSVGTNPSWANSAGAKSTQTKPWVCKPA